MAPLLSELTQLEVETLDFDTPLEVSPVISLGLILGSAGLAMLVAALVAWGSLRVCPLDVLRYE